MNFLCKNFRRAETHLPHPLCVQNVAKTHFGVRVLGCLHPRSECDQSVGCTSSLPPLPSGEKLSATRPTHMYNVVPRTFHPVAEFPDVRRAQEELDAELSEHPPAKVAERIWQGLLADDAAHVPTMKAADARYTFVLWGPCGSGKTRVLSRVASALGVPMESIGRAGNDEFLRAHPVFRTALDHRVASGNAYQSAMSDGVVAALVTRYTDHVKTEHHTAHELVNSRKLVGLTQHVRTVGNRVGNRAMCRT